MWLCNQLCLKLTLKVKPTRGVRQQDSKENNENVIFKQMKERLQEYDTELCTESGVCSLKLFMFSSMLQIYTAFIISVVEMLLFWIEYK